jgi:5-methylcytosine-specific restriction endonuclease McrA
MNNLEVHHRTYERVGEERPADVIALCKACHEKHHDRHDRGRYYIGDKDDPELASLPGRVAE